MDNNFFPDILIRLQSNIHDADCVFDSKFGSHTKEATSIMEYANNNNNIRIRGISFHIGSGGYAISIISFRYSNK